VTDPEIVAAWDAIHDATPRMMRWITMGCLVSLFAGGCIGKSDTVRFGVINDRSTEVIVQPEQPLQTDLPAWTVEAHNTFGWDVPNGSVVRVFSDTCQLLWQGRARSGGALAPTYVFHADGTITVEGYVGLVDDVGSAPTSHAPCP
jgi:hypothetical protein